MTSGPLFAVFVTHLLRHPFSLPTTATELTTREVAIKVQTTPHYRSIIIAVGIGIHIQSGPKTAHQTYGRNFCQILTDFQNPLEDFLVNLQ